MTLTIRAGSDPRYLTKAVATGSEHYYLKAIEVGGEPPGVWAGAGAGALGLTGEVDAQVMTTLYSAFVDPSTGERLGTAPPQYRPIEERIAAALDGLPEDATEEERERVVADTRATQRSAVMYFDLTDSMQKSFSVAHAAFQVLANQARRDGDTEAAELWSGRADAVWDAVMDGNNAMLDYMQEHAGFSRAGRNGVRRVDAHEWVVATFRQHTSRADDPQLHVHNAVLARVATTERDPVTGEDRTVWRALDGRALFAVRPAAAAVAERVAEESLARRLGLAVGMRPDGKAREILGITEMMRDAFSTRRHEVVGEVANLVEAYEAKHGRAPDAYSLSRLADQAAISTRDPKKHHAPTREELLDRWEAQAVERLRDSLADVPEAVYAAAAEHGLQPRAFDPYEVVTSAVEEVQRRRATWSRADLIAEINRQLPDCLGGLGARRITGLLSELADSALDPALPMGPTVLELSTPEVVPVPVELTLADSGASRYARAECVLYSTREHLGIEAAITAAARDRTAHALPVEDVERAVAGIALSPAQAEAIRGIATGGRFVSVLVGPAGTGKSYTIGHLARMWEADGGTVLGLAPGQRQADVLREEGLGTVANVRKILDTYERIAAGQRVSAEDRETHQFRRGQLVVVDESGAAGTVDQHAILAHAWEAGAKVLLAGDWGQTTSVEAGGMFGQLARDEHVDVYELDEVRRFESAWEGPASLRLRAGDASVLREYDARGRLLCGSVEEMRERAYRGWLTDHLDGHESLLIVSSNGLAAELSARARADLVRYGLVEPDGVPLADQMTVAGVGDIVQLRDINRAIRSGDGRHVATNRDVVTVAERHEDGGLRVSYDDGSQMDLPASYVAEYVTLAYATTVNAAQGRTVWSGHNLAGEGDTREHYYTAMSRGKRRNSSYLALQDDPQAWMRDVPGGLDPGDPRMPEQYAVLTGILSRSEAEQTATETMRARQDLAESLATLAPQWGDVVEEHDAARFGRILLAELGPEQYARLRDEAAYGSLVRLARQVGESGRWDPAEMLASVIRGRGMDGVESIGRVVHWRMSEEITQRSARAAQIDAHEAAGAEETQIERVDQALAPVQGIDLALGWDDQGRPTEEAERRALAQVEAMQQVEVLHLGQGDEVRSRQAEAERQRVEARADYLSRTPETLTGPVGWWARQVARVMDHRVERLGERMTDAPPAWAIERLGQVPEDPLARRDWTKAAGLAQAYREAHGYEDPGAAIGPIPPPGSVDARHAWERAARALGIDLHADAAAAPDADLRRRVADYEREEQWAPQHVGERLKDAHLTREHWRGEMVVARAEAAQADPARRAELALLADGYELLALASGEAAETLESAHAVRAAWYDHTEDARQAARAARDELARRAPEAGSEPAEPIGPADAARTGHSIEDEPEWTLEPAEPTRAGHRIEDEPEWTLAEVTDAAERAEEILAERARAQRAQEEADRDRRDADHIEAQAIEYEDAEHHL
ncbi:MobF family relaxase [Embleya sp. NPDC005971]|uniref:MobF family relaxase n=1 Tax=Embleya sp. NPDC005971 TaxID=3156724 RepID=UPI0033E8E2A1